MAGSQGRYILSCLNTILTCTDAALVYTPIRSAVGQLFPRILTSSCLLVSVSRPFWLGLGGTLLWVSVWFGLVFLFICLFCISLIAREPEDFFFQISTSHLDSFFWGMSSHFPYPFLHNTVLLSLRFLGSL